MIHIAAAALAAYLAYLAIPASRKGSWLRTRRRARSTEVVYNYAQMRLSVTVGLDTKFPYAYMYRHLGDNAMFGCTDQSLVVLSEEQCVYGQTKLQINQGY